MTIDLIRGFVKYSELIAAIVGTIYYYKYKTTPLKYFLLLLWYITLTEFLGWASIKYEIKALLFYDENELIYNLWLYNLLEIITFSFLFYIYYKSLSANIHKFWVSIFFISFLIVTIINWFFIQSFILEWSELPNIFGSLFLIVIILFYFIELLKSEQILIFHKSLLFWISVGLLIFYACTIPFSIKMNGYALIPGIHKLFLIIYVSAIIMYLTFTFGFIWSKKE